MYGSNYPNYGCNIFNHSPFWRIPYPEVDTQYFQQAALTFQALMEDASQLTNALADNTNLAHDIMANAQENNLQRVEELVQSTGVKGKVDVRYNPDGIHFEMSSHVSGVDCCKPNMAINWR
ncbi:hypothetical protein JNUCC1_00209 [Lentibacillus sp. JNUCC-1]|uniref:hypothetical protein n=1 Tax=Lentibacillus sp. JNUCC-1 TaxID=2654513 RepID=UPI0012E90A35|nr:hypothetical protein [Lentibacillus sp. JNUCC-1]MUV36407.1 hypothetical protein [Lentibacillus sp. JNUCC-1]